MVQHDLDKQAAELKIQEAEAIVAKNNLKKTDNAAYLALSDADRTAMDEALAAAKATIDTQNGELTTLAATIADTQKEIDAALEKLQQFLAYDANVDKKALEDKEKEDKAAYDAAKAKVDKITSDLELA